MKVKDLKISNLAGIKVKIPKQFEDKYVNVFGEMYLYSFWNAGIWLKRKMSDERIYPLVIELKEVLNFTVIKEKNEKTKKVQSNRL